MKELESLWTYNREKIINKNIKQLLNWISDLSKEEQKEELREFFHLVPIEQLEKYIYECINDKFNENGYIFQDLVNELGIRLGFDVTFGLYKGIKGKNGFDGIWRDKHGYAFVVEVKVTDSFAIKLDTVNKYRKDLIQKGDITEENSSILFVLGREDLKTMSSTINGSKYGWCTTQIGIERLLTLTKNKIEHGEDEILDEQIIGMLKPKDNVKVDGIVDLVLLNDKKKENKFKSETSKKYAEKEFTKKKREPAVNFYEACVKKIEKELKVKLTKQDEKAKTLYMDDKKRTGIIITNSKRTISKNQEKYWFAYHKHFKDYVSKYDSKYIAFGCGDEKTILLIPIKVMEEAKEKMRDSKRPNRLYWHVLILHKNDKFYMRTPLGSEKELDVSEYRL